MLSPSKAEAALEDDVIEIPDSAGLSDETREAIFNVWATDDLDEDSGFVEGMHYTRVLPTVLYLNLLRTVRQHNINSETQNSILQFVTS